MAAPKDVMNPAKPGSSGNLEEPTDGFDFLATLRQKTGEKHGAFSSLERYLDHKARQTGTPLTGQFELTPLCNFDCKMCYSHLTAEQLCRLQVTAAGQTGAQTKMATEHPAGQSITTTEQWKDLMHQAWEMECTTWS